MLRITELNLPQYTLTWQQHPSKRRFRNHNKDFNHGQYRENTELSKCMWWLKEEQIISRIRWSVVEKVYGKRKIYFCPP